MVVIHAQRTELVSGQSRLLTGLVRTLNPSVIFLQGAPDEIVATIAQTLGSHRSFMVFILLTLYYSRKVCNIRVLHFWKRL